MGAHWLVVLIPPLKGEGAKRREAVRGRGRTPTRSGFALLSRIGLPLSGGGKDGT